VTEAVIDTPLRETPLAGLHRELGARMVPFAGYSMPVQYPAGIIKEHNWTRTHAGLFDVSHMGQAAVAASDHETAARALEDFMPGDFRGLAPGRMRYSLLLNDAGGTIDDLMVARSWSPEDDGVLALVVNAARKDADYAHLRAGLRGGVTLATYERGLLAIQGPKAAAVLARHVPEVATMPFMSAILGTIVGIACSVTRSGYTGEDGFELSVASEDAEALARALLASPEVLPVGLGARDSLRLEAGLPLYGHDLDETVSPVEAGLAFAVAKRRRQAADFPGAGRILREIAGDLTRSRVGLLVEGAPAREGASILDADGATLGTVTSGGFSPTLGRPIAMGYVPPAHSALGAALQVVVRGRAQPATVTALPFVPHRYVRQPVT
jgi:aminomethyltransferase